MTSFFQHAATAFFYLHYKTGKCYAQEKRPFAEEPYCPYSVGDGRAQLDDSIRRTQKGHTVKKTAEITGFSPKTITDYTRKYLEKGAEELLIERRDGRRSENMTYKEVAFLRTFDKRIDAGEIITVKELHQAYQKNSEELPILVAFITYLNNMAGVV